MKNLIVPFALTFLLFFASCDMTVKKQIIFPDGTIATAKGDALGWHVGGENIWVSKIGYNDNTWSYEPECSYLHDTVIWVKADEYGTPAHSVEYRKAKIDEYEW